MTEASELNSNVSFPFVLSFHSCFVKQRHKERTYKCLLLFLITFPFSLLYLLYKMKCSCSSAAIIRCEQHRCTFIVVDLHMLPEKNTKRTLNFDLMSTLLTMKDLSCSWLLLLLMFNIVTVNYVYNSLSKRYYIVTKVEQKI